MRAPAHLNIVFLSGDMNPLRPDLGDRRFMVVELLTAEANRLASSSDMTLLDWTRAVLARATAMKIDEVPLGCIPLSIDACLATGQKKG